ncbi:MAG: hypothetical protein QXR06_00900 [Candidatus Bathyarchaeia archaeon]|nr:hypothetical protein [Candidatus Bathyarchaeota archaeon]
MADYLKRFNEKLRERYPGCLVKVKDIEKIEPNAKEYLNRLAKAGLIEKVRWGWYWVPEDIKDPWDFFEKDKRFKIISRQTAASLWNNDFVHREIYSLKVLHKPYGRALEEIARKRGWSFQIEYVNKPANYRKIGRLFIENMDETIIECMKIWAFIDAFSTLYLNRNKISLKDLLKKSYWKRIKGTNIRVRQALEYGCSLINELISKEIFKVRKPKLEDSYVKREIEEAVRRVVELG